MAVTYEGAESLETESSTDPKSFSVTVPTDANLIVVAISGYSSGDATLVDVLNFDNGGTQDFTTRGRAYYSGTEAQLHVLTMDSSSGDWPGTGSKTLYYSPTTAYSEGFNVHVSYFGGVDTTNPIRDSEEVDSGEFSSPQTSSLTSVGSDEMGYMAVWSYEGGADVNPATYGQTAVLESGVFNNAYLSVGYEPGEGSLRVESSATFTGIVYLAFRAAAGSYTLDAASGTFTLTGTAAGLEKGSVLEAESGSFTLTGADAGLYRGYPLNAEAGSFVLTGQDVSLIADRVLDAASGSFVLTGTDANLLKGFVLSAESATFVFTGQDATLTYTPLGSYTLEAESGVFTLTGQAVDLLKGYAVDAESGEFVLTGQVAGLLRGYPLTAESGSFVLTGQDAGFIWNKVIVAESGAFVFTGFDATLTYSALVTIKIPSFEIQSNANPIEFYSDASQIEFQTNANPIVFH